MTVADLEKRVKELEAKGLTAWGKLPDNVKLGVAVAVTALTVYMMVKLHIL